MRAADARGRRAYFAYLLRCGDGSYYAGFTVNPLGRLESHRRGRASRYTRGRGPLALAAVWWCPTRRAALRLELMLKGLSHRRKRRLAGGARLAVFLPGVASLGARRLGANLRSPDPRTGRRDYRSRGTSSLT